MGRLIDQARAIRTAMDKAGNVLTDAQALDMAMLYREWVAGEPVTTGDTRRYQDKLYRCVQAHTTQIGWAPDATPALWIPISVEEWPDWRQPSGAYDAYDKGAKVNHKDQHWVSSTDANVWEPGIYGWNKA